MRGIFKGLLAVAALTMMAAAPARASTAIPIASGDGWHTFDFLGVGSSFQDQSGVPVSFVFTLTQADVFRIADGFDPEQQFDVAILNLGDLTSINFETTAPTPTSPAFVGDCWSCAFFDPAYNTIFSTGSVILGPGTYDVTGFAVVSPQGNGVAALEVGAVPEPATWAMMLAGLLGLGGALRARRQRALAEA